MLPRPDYHFSGDVGRTYLDTAKPQFPQPVQAPKGAPNIVLILIDDAGFGQFSTFGGGVPSPTMDKLAAEGLRYNRFHTTALCSPTRAALITGRNHHSAATGVIGEMATGYDGYTSVIPRSHGSVGEVLRQNGYMTAWIGKNHNTPGLGGERSRPVRPLGERLRVRLFLRLQWRRHEPLEPDPLREPEPRPGLDRPELLPDHRPRRQVHCLGAEGEEHLPRPAVLPVRRAGRDPRPHHVPKEWIDKFRGKFDMGWDQYREETFARQKQLGVIPPETKLTKRSEGLPAWDSLNADQKRLYARMMEVFAGYGASVDFEMGRIIDAVKQLPGADNTLFIYIAGDNGSSAEGGLEGTLNENLFFNGFPDKWEDELKVIDELGGRSTTTTSRPRGRTRWTRPSNGPSRWPATSAAPATR